MEILKAGLTYRKRADTKKYKVTCNECECTFIIDKEEMRPYLIQGGFYEQTWECPWCGTTHQTEYGVGIKEMLPIEEESEED